MTLPNDPSLPPVLRLQGIVQHYDWGGTRCIPDLLGVQNPEARPFAELWIGAHPGAPSKVRIGGQDAGLDELIERSPEAILGTEVARRFGGRLPYLLKVLDARKMLSIQVHPTRQQAKEGFAREDAAGVPQRGPNRNYRDDNHKPEVHVALTEFWMLHGFRPLEEIETVLGRVPELAPLMPEFGQRLAGVGADPRRRAGLLRDLYEAVMTMPQERVDAILDPLVARLGRETPAQRDDPGFWALRAAHEFPLPGGSRDRGIFSIYLLNLVHLGPGQGTYQPAGALHAYLEGANVELMASSDNVLRGGLTPKHVDVGELLSVVQFRDGQPEVLEGAAVSPTERLYATPAEEFALSRVELSPEEPHRERAAAGPHALVVTEGGATVRWEGGQMELPRGGIALARHGAAYNLEASVPTVLFKAAIPAGSFDRRVSA